MWQIGREVVLPKRKGVKLARHLPPARVVFPRGDAQTVYAVRHLQHGALELAPSKVAHQHVAAVRLGHAEERVDIRGPIVLDSAR